MNKLKHTPGQWGFLFGKTPETVETMEVLSENSWNGKRWSFKDIYIGANDRVIAQIIHRTTEDGVSVEEFEANAKLIVAAPDLLQAAINMIAHLDEGKDLMMNVAYELKQAIKKATT